MSINLHNYPNPLFISNARNPITTLAFDLSQQQFQRAEIKIYNSKGQMIQTLPVPNNNSTKFEMSWNGQNSDNKFVASGIYYYQLVLDGRTVATRSCTVIK